jgi:general secretion pathway protein C
MTVFLRKHFWAVNLCTIALCALFAARAVGRLVESGLSEPPARKTATMTTPVDTSLSAPTGRDISAILARNIFCSACEKVVETPSKGGTDDKPASNDPVKTSLNLKLLATLVSDEDKAWSFAVILDPGQTAGQAGRSRMYSIGMKLPGETATLTDVTDRRVYLLNGNRHEYLELDSNAAPTAAKSSGEPVVSLGAAAGLSGVEEEVARSIRKISENKYEVARDALNKVLANTTILARSARIVPSVKNGQPNGFKLYAIRPGSLYSLLGMQNGDTLSAVNGHAMTTPDAALDVYTKLRNASHLTISFDRGGNTVTNEYNIR